MIGINFRDNINKVSVDKFSSVNKKEEKIKEVKIIIPAEDPEEKVINPDNYKEEEICSICMERKINTVIVDCGHRCTCVTCCQNFKEQNKPLCPICRKDITHIIKTY